MPRDQFAEFLAQLRSTRFRDLAGARVWAAVPLTGELANRIVRDLLPKDVPVREVTLHPEAGNQVAIRITPRAALLPSITLKLSIERQPQLPGDPVLVLRMATLPGLFGMAAGALPREKLLPAGVRLDGERILVDLAALARRHGAGDALEYVRELTITTEPGRFLLHVDASV